MRLYWDVHSEEQVGELLSIFTSEKLSSYPMMTCCPLTWLAVKIFLQQFSCRNVYFAGLQLLQWPTVFCSMLRFTNHHLLYSFTVHTASQLLWGCTLSAYKPGNIQSIKVKFCRASSHVLQLFYIEKTVVDSGFRLGGTNRFSLNDQQQLRRS